MESSKERLRTKINNKKKNRSKKKDSSESEDSLFTMLNQVNKTLKENPQMIDKVNKCINSIFENKDLMESIVSEIDKNVQSEAQTFERSSDVLNTQASE